MRHSRLTYKRAYHHVMNRGDKGEKIFGSRKFKLRFMDLLKEKSEIYKICIYAYCIMDNHFHLIIQNTSGKMSEFMRSLNGKLSINYRAINKDKGYVFQNRYRSTLIGEGKYIRTVIIYVLLNPVRAGLVLDPYDYKWSSIGEYFTNKNIDCLVDNVFVEELFGDKTEFDFLLNEWKNRESIPVKTTRIGKIMGEKDFISEAMKKFDRRQVTELSRRMRQKEYSFRSTGKIIKEFETAEGLLLKDIDYTTKEGKIIRNKLLVKLKDQGGAYL